MIGKERGSRGRVLPGAVGGGEAPGRRLILDYLRELRSHNDRDWFEAQRTRYDEARAAFETLLGELIDAFGAVDDLGPVSVKDCAFRLNRDVRFSKDKTPYKTAMSALVGARGRKSGPRSYYFHLEPDGLSMLAGGLHSPTPAELAALRSSIAEGGAPLRKILAEAAFVAAFGGLEGASLKTVPRGYPADHPELGLLRRTQFLATHHLDDSMVLSPLLIGHSLDIFGAMKPFVVYLEGALEGGGAGAAKGRN